MVLNHYLHTGLRLIMSEVFQVYGAGFMVYLTLTLLLTIVTNIVKANVFISFKGLF